MTQIQTILLLLFLICSPEGISRRSALHVRQNLPTSTIPALVDYGPAIECPEPRLIFAAESQNEIDQAFSAWKDEFLSLDCDGGISFFVDGQLVDIYRLNAPDMCGDTLTLTMKMECGNSCSSQFITQPGPHSLNISLPVVDFSCYSATTFPDFEKLVPLYSLAYTLAFGVPSPCIDITEIELTVDRVGPIIQGNEVTEIRTYRFLLPGGSLELATQILTIYWDPNPPVLSGLPEDLELTCNSALPAWPVVTASDQESSAAIQVTTSQLTSNSSCSQVFRTWQATDDCGNSTLYTQTISFIDDEPPILIVPPDTTLLCDQIIPPSDYKAYDHCSDVRVYYEEINENIDQYALKIWRIWTVWDGCQNVSRDSQLILIKDSVPPIITPTNNRFKLVPPGGEIIVFGCQHESRFGEDDIDVFDQCSGVSVTTSDDLVSSGNCDILGYYNRWKCTALATDEAGNISEYFFYVLQYDTMAPILHNVPGDLVMGCGDKIPARDTSVYVEDDCSLIAAPEFSEEVVTIPEDDSKKLIIRRWSAIDRCGNRSEAFQNILVCNPDTMNVSASLGNSVWEDINHNGIRDNDESGINGINVFLYRSAPGVLGDLQLVTSTTTSTIDEKIGQFLFDHLAADEYRIFFDIPENYFFTELKAGHDDELDSDVNPETGMTGMIRLNDGQQLMSIDAGLVKINSADFKSNFEFSRFAVTSLGCSHTISWSTLDEEGIASMIVQFSKNGSDFHDIQNVQPRGSSSETVTYSFTDPTNRSGGYYRLMITEASGAKQYSEWIKVDGRCIDDQNIILYPNPFREIFQIEFVSHETGEAEIVIFDHLGRRVQNSSIETNEGTNKKIVNLQDLPSGSYMIQIQIAGLTDQKWILKSH